MNDPVARTLARFTPAPTGLDRDELLFRAGRASAGRARGWKLAAGLLAVTQAVTLTALLRRDGLPTAQPLTPPPVAAPEPPPAEESPPADPASYLVLSHGWDGGALPASSSSPGSDRPARPLTAGGWRGGPLD